VTHAQRVDADTMDVLARLRQRFGVEALDVCEEWDADCGVVGHRLSNGEERLLYFVGCRDTPGCYDVVLDADAPGRAAGVTAAEHRAAVDFDSLAALVARHLSLGGSEVH
jgi:hypothetical protein